MTGRSWQGEEEAYCRSPAAMEPHALIVGLQARYVSESMLVNVRHASGVVMSDSD